MIPFLLSLVAFAGGRHGGIPVSGVPGLGDPSFETSSTGWTAQIEGGYVRVFVGRDELEARSWVDRMTLGFSKPLAPYAGSIPAEDLHGDGKGLLLLRDGNVGLLVRADPAGPLDAETWARTLLAAMVPDAPWPAPPVLKASGNQWVVEAPGAKQVAFHGGHLAANQGLVFTEPPIELVAWDAYGRASVWVRKSATVDWCVTGTWVLPGRAFCRKAGRQEGRKRREGRLPTPSSCRVGDGSADPIQARPASVAGKGAEGRSRRSHSCDAGRTSSARVG